MVVDVVVQIEHDERGRHVSEVRYQPRALRLASGTAALGGGQ
jgi:hypothetical protein